MHDPGWDLGHAAFVTALALVAAGIVILVVHLLSRRLGRWDPVLASLAGRARYAFRALIVIVALLIARRRARRRRPWTGSGTRWSCC